MAAQPNESGNIVPSGEQSGRQSSRLNVEGANSSNTLNSPPRQEQAPDEFAELRKDEKSVTDDGIATAMEKLTGVDSEHIKPLPQIDVYMAVSAEHPKHETLQSFSNPEKGFVGMFNSHGEVIGDHTPALIARRGIEESQGKLRTDIRDLDSSRAEVNAVLSDLHERIKSANLPEGSVASGTVINVFRGPDQELELVAGVCGTDRVYFVDEKEIGTTMHEITEEGDNPYVLGGKKSGLMLEDEIVNDGDRFVVLNEAVQKALTLEEIEDILYASKMEGKSGAKAVGQKLVEAAKAKGDPGDYAAMIIDIDTSDYVDQAQPVENEPVAETQRVVEPQPTAEPEPSPAPPDSEKAATAAKAEAKLLQYELPDGRRVNLRLRPETVQALLGKAVFNDERGVYVRDVEINDIRGMRGEELQMEADGIKIGLSLDQMKYQSKEGEEARKKVLGAIKRELGDNPNGTTQGQMRQMKSDFESFQKSSASPRVQAERTPLWRRIFRFGRRR